MKTYSRILSFVLSSAFSSLLLFSANAQAGTLTLSQVPLYLGGSVEPNIMFTLDDSGSMHWEVMPDSILFTYYMFPRASGIYGAGDYTNYVPGFDPGNRHNSFLRASSNNKIYYDPALRYLPWAKSNGTLFPNANITCAPHNPFDPGKGCRDLTQNNSQSARWLEDSGSFSSNQTRTFWPATYFKFNGGNVWTYSDYTRIEIRSGSTYIGGSGRTDCAAAPTCTYAEEIQNFANWYTYDRSRILLSRSGVGQAFTQQGTNMRVGFAAINKSSTTIDGVSSPGTLVRGLRQFSGSDRDNFFNDLYGHVMVPASTPLRRALDDVGQYFQRTDNRGPWSATPGTSNSTPHLSCRQNFNVFMSDGFWNSATARTSAARANVDNNSGPNIIHPSDPAKNYQYSASTPYKDVFENTLADVGMYYWYRDLRTDLKNDVPPNVDDPAYWQHLVNFTVGLGVLGTLNPATDLPNLADASKTWPDPDPTPANPAAKIDDLWHTAVNSRGEFFSASNPNQFATSLANVLNNIVSRTGSSAAPSLNSGSIGSHSHLYQARFNSGTWVGEMVALPINPDGTLGAQSWEASVALATQNFNTGREIISYDPVSGSGIPFRHASLNAAQKAALDINPATLVADGRSAERVNFLRGNTASEAQNGGPFRTRTTLLGDIINSGPVFVGGANSIYPDKWDDATGVSPSTPENVKPYSAFRNTYFTRQRMLYFGANDGFLHGVDAGTYDSTTKTFSTGTGHEEIAYAPAKLLDKLNRLTAKNYNHRFYVDGATTVVDGFFAGDWHTVLGGGYAAGGQGVYALDVTDPSAFDEINAANLVLWEFTDADDRDLGNTYGQPINVVRLHNGEWAALFSNGYNNTEPDGNVSTTGNAVLFIVSLETGALLKKIDTGQGSAQDPTGLGKPNGLSVAAPTDLDGDFIVDAAYAGDLFGNMWKFDLSDKLPANWTVAFGGDPLFQTRQNASGIRQPITVRPQIGEAPHDSEIGLNKLPNEASHDSITNKDVLGSIVYFGTGKYFEVGDGIAVGQDTQTFYAVWDKQIPSGDTFHYSAPPFGPDQLLSQEISQEIAATDATNPFGFDLRLTTSKPITWHLVGDTISVPSGSPVTTHFGWKIDMIDMGSAAPQNYGERIISRPVLRAGRIIFTTLIPDPDPCGAGGTGWLMELDATSGKSLAFSPFDLNHDGLFNSHDFIAVSSAAGAQRVPVSGKRSTIGIISTPGILDAGDQQTEFKYTSGSSGGIEVTTENSGGSVGRLNWQQL